jgi:hypothetical protein
MFLLPFFDLSNVTNESTICDTQKGDVFDALDALTIYSVGNIPYNCSQGLVFGMIRDLGALDVYSRLELSNYCL